MIVHRIGLDRGGGHGNNFIYEHVYGQNFLFRKSRFQFCVEGKQLFVPVMLSSNGQMNFVELKNTNDLVKNSWGILEPPQSKNEILQPSPKIDTMIVPGVAFSPGYIRLGRGGGFYDRFLSRYMNIYGTLPFTIGIGFDCQKVDELFCEEHDVLIDDLVTS